MRDAIAHILYMLAAKKISEKQQKGDGPNNVSKVEQI